MKAHQAKMKGNEAPKGQNPPGTEENVQTSKMKGKEGLKNDKIKGIEGQNRST